MLEFNICENTHAFDSYSNQKHIHSLTSLRDTDFGMYQVHYLQIMLHENNFKYMTTIFADNVYV